MTSYKPCLEAPKVGKHECSRCPECGGSGCDPCSWAGYVQPFTNGAGVKP